MPMPVPNPASATHITAPVGPKSPGMRTAPPRAMIPSVICAAIAAESALSTMTKSFWQACAAQCGVHSVAARAAFILRSKLSLASPSSIGLETNATQAHAMPDEPESTRPAAARIRAAFTASHTPRRRDTAPLPHPPFAGPCDRALDRLLSRPLPPCTPQLPREEGRER